MSSVIADREAYLQKQHIFLQGFKSKHTTQYVEDLRQLFLASFQRNQSRIAVRQTTARIKKELPCMNCGIWCCSPRNMHFDHVEPELKQFKIANLLLNSMATPPSKAAYKNKGSASAGEFHTSYDAIFAELPNLALVCALCHAQKTFCEYEIAFFGDDADEGDGDGDGDGDDDGDSDGDGD
jgi:hypothetical protein